MLFLTAIRDGKLRCSPATSTSRCAFSSDVLSPPILLSALATCGQSLSFFNSHQVDLGAPSVVTGLLVQGGSDGWLLRFGLMLSNDGNIWKVSFNAILSSSSSPSLPFLPLVLFILLLPLTAQPYSEAAGIPLSADCDSKGGTAAVLFYSPPTTRMLRLVPVLWHAAIVARIEVLVARPGRVFAGDAAMPDVSVQRVQWPLR
jgi:hypothetical protein